MFVNEKTNEKSIYFFRIICYDIAIKNRKAAIAWISKKCRIMRRESRIIHL